MGPRTALVAIALVAACAQPPSRPPSLDGGVPADDTAPDGHADAGPDLADAGVEDAPRPPVPGCPVASDAFGRCSETVGVGLTQGCAIASTGAVWCWGRMPESEPTAPHRVIDGAGALVVSEGGETCAIVGTTLWCWNVWPPTIGSEDPFWVRDPNAVPLAGPATDVRFDLTGGMVALSEGRALCWGNNDNDACGAGAPSPWVWPPRPVDGLPPASRLAFRFAHGAWVGDQLWVSGSGSGGTELERLTFTSTAVPAPVDFARGAIDLDADRDMICALESSGVVACVGAVPRRLAGEDAATTESVLVETPRPVLDGITHLAGGPFHACAVREDGTVLCWGSDLDGALGDGPGAPDLCDVGGPCSLGAVEVLDIDDAIDLAVGPATSCVRRASGGVWCWGRSDYGQAGQVVPRLDRPARVTGFD